MNEHAALADLHSGEAGVCTDSSRLTLAWIWLGVYALVAAGLLSLALALSRTPVIQDLMPGTAFFRVALVAHVDLSVLVWFSACAGMLWSMFGRAANSSWNKLAFFMSLSGALMISAAPFAGSGEPIMNNYVPVLRDPVFFCGLFAVIGGLVMQAAHYVICNPPDMRATGTDDVLRFALYTAALAALLAVGCVALSYLRIVPGTKDEFFFDLLFWGGGHVLQFMNTTLMLVALLLLANAAGTPALESPRLGRLLFALVGAPLLAVPWLYRFPIESREHILGFTALMRYGGLAAIPLLGCVLAALRRRPALTPQAKPLRATLLCSLTLFCGGGIMGFMITGSNTVIPAHYHGSVVGITLAFMGVVYLLLPRLGKPITLPRAAYWQPFLYGGGQLMHITALAWTGGYGVKRKIAGAAQGLDSVKEIAGMGLMGLGGLIAVIGGIVFCVVVIAALLARGKARAAA